MNQTNLDYQYHTFKKNMRVVLYKNNLLKVLVRFLKKKKYVLDQIDFGLKARINSEVQGQCMQEVRLNNQNGPFWLSEIYEIM